jgi:molybdopterin-containing oxidoreductase family membrane subunit
VIQAWLKRFIIVVPVLENPFLTDTAITGSTYQPTWVEWSITAGALAGFVLVYYLLSRMVPIISVWETAHAKVVEPVLGSAPALPTPATTSSPEV